VPQSAQDGEERQNAFFANESLKPSGSVRLLERASRNAQLKTLLATQRV